MAPDDPMSLKADTRFIAEKPPLPLHRNQTLPNYSHRQDKKCDRIWLVGEEGGVVGEDEGEKRMGRGGKG